MVRAEESDCMEDIRVRGHEIVALLFLGQSRDEISRGEQKKLI